MLEEWAEKINNSGKLVIVEGEHDRDALGKLGIKKVECLSRKPLFSFMEDIAEKAKDVILLTDLDNEGKSLYRKLKDGLQKLGVRIDTEFREYLLRHTKVTQIEGIASYAGIA